MANQSFAKIAGFHSAGHIYYIKGASKVVKSGAYILYGTYWLLKHK